jgi:hypothetical protein
MSVPQDVTCGPLYQEALQKLVVERFPVLTLSDVQKGFASGFLAGLAEKVCLGASRACMVRPFMDNRGWFFDVAKITSDVYGLLGRVYIYQDPERGEMYEIWLLRDRAALGLFLQMEREEVNSRKWHHMRGRLCGVPLNEIDEEFHKRRSLEDGK